MKKSVIFIIVCIASLFFILSGVLLFKEQKVENSIIELNYPYVGKYHDGYTAVSDGKKLYYIDQTGQKKFTFLYTVTDNEMLDSFYYQDDYFIAPKGQLLGIIDQKGKEILKPDYQKIDMIDQKTILVTDKSGAQYLIDFSGKRLMKEEYYDITRTNSTLLIARQNTKLGMITRDGRVVVPFEYDLIQETNDGKYYIATKVSFREKGALYRRKKDTLEKVNIDFSACIFANDTYIHLQDSLGKNLIYDCNNETIKILQNQYDFIAPFENGLAFAVNNNGQAGFINEQEEIVVPFLYAYQRTTSFNNAGFAVIGKLDGKTVKYGVIDKKNNEILPFEYDDILFLSENLIAVSKDDNTYRLQTLDQTTRNQSYTSVQNTLRDDLFLVTNGTLEHPTYGLINQEGKEIYPPTQQEIRIYEDQIIIKKNNSSYVIDLSI